MVSELTIFEGKPSYKDLANGLQENRVVQAIAFFLKSENIISRVTANAAHGRLLVRKISVMEGWYVRPVAAVLR